MKKQERINLQMLQINNMVLQKIYCYEFQCKIRIFKIFNKTFKLHSYRLNAQNFLSRQIFFLLSIFLFVKKYRKCRNINQ